MSASAARAAVSASNPGASQLTVCSPDVATYTRERAGVSAFVIEDCATHHTYSTYLRGLDGLWGASQ